MPGRRGPVIQLPYAAKSVMVSGSFQSAVWSGAAGAQGGQRCPFALICLRLAIRSTAQRSAAWPSMQPHLGGLSR